MTLKEDIKEIGEHIGTINSELGVVKNELKWHKWLLLVCFFLLLALLGINTANPKPFLAGGLSILLFGLK